MKIITCIIVSLLMCVACVPTGPSRYEQILAEMAQREAIQKEEQAKAEARRTELSKQAETADCGPLPKNWKQLATQAIRDHLKDPDSAQFKFASAPVKSFTESSNGEVIFHWLGACEVNAKNSFGGYTGYKLWLFDIIDGKVSNPSPSPI